jgi:putative transposase
VPDAKRLKALETENARVKKLLAESMLENEATREALRKSPDRTGSAGVGAVDDLEGVVGAAQPTAGWDERERPALPATGRSQRSTEGADHRAGAAASSPRRGDDLPEVAAGRRTRQPQADRAAVSLEKLQVRRRRRKKIPVSERQPLIRPGGPNEVRSAHFVFDCVASGRPLKCLVIVDDATHEAIAIAVAPCMGGDDLVRGLDGLCSLRARPAVIRTDNRKELTGRAMLT